MAQWVDLVIAVTAFEAQPLCDILKAKKSMHSLGSQWSWPRLRVMPGLVAQPVVWLLDTELCARPLEDNQATSM